MDKRICENCANNCIGEDIEIKVESTINVNFSPLKTIKCKNYKSKSEELLNFLLFL